MRLSVRNSAGRGATGVALAALVLGGGAVACTKDKAESSPALTPAAAVAKAAKNTEDITSLHYRMTGKVPEQGRVSGEAAMSMKPLAMSMKMTSEDQAADGPVEMRIVGKAMYIGGGAQAAKDMDGKSWIKFDMSAMAGDKELDANQLGGGQADKNPATESTFLTGSKNVKKVGTETVEGVKTTHYKGTVTLDDFRKSLKGEDKATRAAREKSLEQYTKMGVDTFTMDMWVDGDDHTKQFRMRGTADKGPLDMTITFLDYNEPVSVKAPPAKDTVDLAEMMKGVQQQ
ncbi:MULTISPECIES: LppX_LprAFG lipoprotein [unclassified Streptomyces]|uniref:LppX_LprAFG lipoprotein n=1 Tax=unclassified Streptomyces TaxID=2593676 RepID=UPI002258867C|nr:MULTISPECIES: LppX_LprAFG lipoprotein [unclassified Streptomyces]MCX4989109.1 LppX_LprAFG lipoprotein [Streptomyces sp. NBC_00568]MCX5005670.1 LppX_LprAFG lipoprotein [Streptomyces sp. NBC_00638]